MKKRILSIICAVATLTAYPTAMYADDEYTDAVTFVTEKGIMEGDENGDLRLSDTITRAEFIKMLVSALGVEISTDKNEISFKDVPKEHWAYGFVSDGCGLGLINGYSDDEFGTNDEVTYNQAIAMVLRACGANSLLLSYPYGYVSIAIDSGLLNGLDYEPDSAITRENVAGLLFNAAGCVEDGMLNGLVTNQGIGIFEGKSNEADNTKVHSHGDRSNSGSASSSASGAGSIAGDMSGGGGAPTTIESVDSGGVYYNPYYSEEEYTKNEPNTFKQSRLSPLSTFSIDIDTASYSNMRRFVSNGRMPQAGSVRTEELINYFTYDAGAAEEDTPFSVSANITDCPWSENKLARITLTGTETDEKPKNLIFLIDVSGSMLSANKLPMIKRSLKMMLENLNDDDTVSIITYASGTEVILEPTSCKDRDKIEDIIDSLNAGGGTNGADGLELAYGEAEKVNEEGRVSRIILCSDGDFNIGPSSTDDLKKLITEKRRGGIYLTTMGFGMGNYKDNKMELLADNGNGSCYYIDNMREAKRVFVDKLARTLSTVAEDVKFQVEFNPAVVGEYRLVGYENRILNAEDFANDAIDAGELNSNASVTAVYELVMDGSEVAGDNAEYRYQTSKYKNTDEAFDVKVRYKKPGGGESILKEYPIRNILGDADKDTKFASAVAMLGLKLNGVVDVSYDDIINTAKTAVSNESSFDDDAADRWEFIQLTELIKYIDKR